MNKETYIDILRCLKDAVRRKSPPTKENQQLVSQSRQCSSTPVSLGHGFLSKEQSTLLSWFQLILPVPSTDIRIEGTAFCVATDFIKNGTEKLKRLSQNGFQECIQYHYSRLQKCSLALGDYFKEKVI